ncbi:MAG: CvpA family protein [Clostridiales bacterium]|nr:CvpA family protein [Clostridiales bacterium]
MNILSLIVIGILALYTFLGYKAGLIKTVFSICSMIVALVLTLLISPHISKALQEKEEVVSYFSKKVEKALNLDQIDSAIVTSAEQKEKIEKLPIPKSLKNTLIDTNKKDVYNALKVSDFTEYLSHSLACIIINALCFVITFLVLFIGLRILCTVLDVISKLPVLHQINKLTGLVAGFLRGLITVWLLGIVITIFSGTGFGKSCFEMINESVFLSILYNNNFILNFTVNLSKSLLS